MQKKILLIIRYLFFLFLGLLLAWMSLHKMSPADWADMETALKQARYFLLIPIIILYLLSHWSRAVRWKIMIGSLDYRPTTLHVFFAVLIGYLVNLALPRLGEIVKCSILGKHEKIPISLLLGTIIVERVVDVICLFVVFALAIGLQARDVSEYTLSLLQRGAHTPSWEAWGLIIGLAALFIGLLVVLFRYFGSNPLVRRIRGMAAGIWQGIAKIRTMKKKGWFLFHTILIWSLYYVCTRLGLYALKDLDGLGMTETLSVLGVGSIGMIITPGGIGAYPILVQEILTHYQIREAIGKAAGWLLWLVPTIVIILGGILSLLILTPFNRSSAEDLAPVENS